MAFPTVFQVFYDGPRYTTYTGGFKAMQKWTEYLAERGLCDGWDSPTPITLKILNDAATAHPELWQNFLTLNRLGVL